MDPAAETPLPKWRLMVTGSGLDMALKVPISEPLIRIGSGPNSDIPLPDTVGIAPAHCILEGKPGRYFLREGESRQPVLVNGRRVELHRLRAGDVIALGEITLTVEEILPKGSLATSSSGRVAAAGSGSREPAIAISSSEPPSSGEPKAGEPRATDSKPGEVRAAIPVKFRTATGGPATPAPAPTSAPDSQRPKATAPAAPAPKPPPPNPLAQAAVSGDRPINVLLREARMRKASDLHIVCDLPVVMRINGQLERFWEPLGANDIDLLVKQTCTPAQLETLTNTGDVDFCYAIGADRYRANICKDRVGYVVTFRIVRASIPTPEEAGLPPEVMKLTTYSQGLVLITGPLGAGKTTTMFSLVDQINRTRHDHIITIEDPVELRLPSGNCQVSQRELGIHTQSFSAALRGALREDPDVIVIGDLRDYETARLAISAAETGHLVFASMPSMSASKTLDKLIDMFPVGEQPVVRTTVSESLRGILSQRLLPGANGDQVVGVELLFNSVAIGNIIRDGKSSGLKNAMQTGRSAGMRTLQNSVDELVNKKSITRAVADAALAS